MKLKLILFLLIGSLAVSCASRSSNDDSDKNAESEKEISSSKTISLSDTPVGFASIDSSYSTSGGTTVKTKAELISALKNGGVIIIDGMIDMSEGKLWASGNSSLSTASSALNSFVTSANTSGSYSSYSDWVDKYTASCSTTTEDKSQGSNNSSLYNDLWVLNTAYGNSIKLTISKNDTTLIGKDENCGIRGGSIQINGKNNIIIRNLIIQDPCDPFPHHESGDGYNAQWDGVNIQGNCSNIWIDHCTFEDTLTLAYTTNTTKEKWQIYDGLCDLKNDTTNVTISNCIFKNHDKTMLIGSSDSDGDNTKRFVTLTGNYFENCGQRLPMVRNTTIHIFNNYYDASSNANYSNSYAVGCRKDCIVYAENNYFGSGIKYSFKDSYGSLYSSGNTDESSKGINSNLTGETLFSAASIVDSNGKSRKYNYTAISASEAKASVLENAGAGCKLE